MSATATHTGASHGSAVARSNSHRDRGFTLIELIVVVVVVAILAAIAIPAFMAQRARVHDAATMSDVRQMAYVLQERTLLGNDIVDWSKINDGDTPPPELSEFKSTAGVCIQVSTSATNPDAWCVVGWNERGNYDSKSNAVWLDWQSHGVATKGVPPGTCLNGAPGTEPDDDEGGQVAAADGSPAETTIENIAIKNTAGPTTGSPYDTLLVHFDWHVQGSPQSGDYFTVSLPDGTRKALQEEIKVTDPGTGALVAQGIWESDTSLTFALAKYANSHVNLHGDAQFAIEFTNPGQLVERAKSVGGLAADWKFDTPLNIEIAGQEFSATYTVDYDETYGRPVMSWGNAEQTVVRLHGIRPRSEEWGSKTRTGGSALTARLSLSTTGWALDSSSATVGMCKIRYMTGSAYYEVDESTCSRLEPETQYTGLASIKQPTAYGTKANEVDFVVSGEGAVTDPSATRVSVRIQGLQVQADMQPMTGPFQYLYRYDVGGEASGTKK